MRDDMPVEITGLDIAKSVGNYYKLHYELTARTPENEVLL